MRALLILVFAALSVSAQEITPNTPPSGTTKGSGAVSQLNNAKKADNSGRESAQNPPETSCNKFLSCLSIAQAHGKTKEEQAKEDSLDLLTRRYMWATIVGVFGAWIGLAILICQTIHTRRTTERQLRAYVLADSSIIINVADPILLYPGQVLPQTDARITNTAAGPGAFISIKNLGQTPAFRVMHWGYICFREFPLIAALPARLPIVGNPPTTILGPGQVATKMLELNPALTAAQINDLRNGIGAVYVYGEITYLDTFGQSRITHYRVMYHRMGGAIGVSTGLNFCEEGNDAN